MGDRSGRARYLGAAGTETWKFSAHFMQQNDENIGHGRGVSRKNRTERGVDFVNLFSLNSVNTAP